MFINKDKVLSSKKENFQKVLEKCGNKIYNLNQLICPFCGSEGTLKKNGRIYNKPLGNIYRCKHCGKMFKGNIQPIPMFNYLNNKNKLNITEKRILEQLEKLKVVKDYKNKFNKIFNKVKTKQEKRKEKKEQMSFVDKFKTKEVWDDNLEGIEYDKYYLYRNKNSILNKKEDEQMTLPFENNNEHKIEVYFKSILNDDLSDDEFDDIAVKMMKELEQLGMENIMVEMSDPKVKDKLLKINEKIDKIDDILTKFEDKPEQFEELTNMENTDKKEWENFVMNEDINDTIVIPEKDLLSIKKINGIYEIEVKNLSKFNFSRNKEFEITLIYCPNCGNYYFEDAESDTCEICHMKFEKKIFKKDELYNLVDFTKLLIDMIKEYEDFINFKKEIEQTVGKLSNHRKKLRLYKKIY